MSTPSTSETAFNDIHSLYLALTAQATTLLSELDQFATHITSNPLVPNPDIILNKLRNDAVREDKLLKHHGGILGLDITSATTTTTNLAVVETNQPPPTLNHPDTDLATHRIRSSNIAFLARLWTELKRCKGVVAVRKQVSSNPNSNLVSVSNLQQPHSARACMDVRERSKVSSSASGSVHASRGSVRRQDKEPVTVDIMADGGAVWIKLFTKSLEWVGMDMAREGLVDLGVEEEGEEEDNDGTSTEGEMQDDRIQGNGVKRSRRFSRRDREALEGLKVVKLAREFLAAAKSARFGAAHRHPSVKVYLTKINRGALRDMDMVLEYIEDLGVVVVTADELERDQTLTSYQSSGQQIDQSLQDLTTIFDRMISPSPPVLPTATLNIDCTILIALISDISHICSSEIVIPAHYKGRPSAQDIEGQLLTEPRDPLLPNRIYPVMRGRNLVCTSKAAAHLRNIVRVMGSSTETKRSNIFLSVGPEDRRQLGELQQQLQLLSIHDVPTRLQLPIEIVDNVESGCSEEEECLKLQEKVMQRLSIHPRLSPLNQSVFFHGWRAGVTTLSLNRVVSEWLGRAIDGTLDELEFERYCPGDIAEQHKFNGPRVLICGRERSLLGNAKV
ncbi:hypothetical protein LTR05_006291 [Lithohypha guttulata]|uniref:DUF1308 domain-containing protein n=1 Tax=Lithohypha guttulata TaxID=1690604 RepID=A0AAN7SX08_9EURO|nr:hypothetical protein LTR05_006291 [Lithohypha guttulata]